MNRNLESVLALAAVAAVAGAAAVTLIFPRSATAGDITIDTTPFVSTATRDAVRAEVLQGSALLRDTEWVQQANAAVPFRSSLTRAEAREQYKAARAEVNALTREDSGSMSLKMGTPADRTNVMGAPAR